MRPAKEVLLCFAIALLLTVYGATLYAVLHPHISPAYKSFYIEHTSSEWAPTYYPGTPEQGMVFSRSGLPDWVESTRGLSSRDEWGRWTDDQLGNIAAVSFTQTFDGQLCVSITARAVPWMLGRTLAVRMGNETNSLRVASEDLATYQVQFTDLKRADELEIVLPDKLPAVHDVMPASADPRRLGLNLATLRLIPGKCLVAGSSLQPGTSQR